MKKEMRAVVKRAMKEVKDSVKELRKWWTGEKKDVVISNVETVQRLAEKKNETNAIQFLFSK